MNIVDNNINIHKYILSHNQRHVSHTNDISHWLCLNENNINNKKKHIINIHKKFLDQTNINIITKCIKHEINIVPVLHRLYDYIDILIEESFRYQNVNILKLINEHVVIDNKYLIEYMKNSCEDGNFNVVKYLHKKINLTKKDFQSSSNYACRFAGSYGHVNVVKYLHQEIGLTKQDFQSHNNLACRCACENGYVNVVKYLHKKIGLIKKDFQSNKNSACLKACENGHIDVVKYLHKEIGLEKKDFQSNYNNACQNACKNGHNFLWKF